EKHARVRSGKADNRECANQRRGHEAVRVMKRQRDLAYPSVFIPRHEQYVIALAQQSLLLRSQHTKCRNRCRNSPLRSTKSRLWARWAKAKNTRRRGRAMHQTRLLRVSTAASRVNCIP